MRKIITLSLVLLAFIAKAQYVNIRDSNFRNFLIYKYPSCFNAAKQMDTSCAAVVNEDSLEVFNYNYAITNFDGFQYFKNLKFLEFKNVPGSSINILPPNIEGLDIAGNYINSITALPSTLKYLNCWANSLTSLPTLPTGLEFLDCGRNQITILPTLPTTLTYLNCSENQLHGLPNLPNTLLTLVCGDNILTNLPPLPNTLIELNYGGVHSGMSQIHINKFPDSLLRLSCDNNEIDSLPDLPKNLTSFSCSQNLLKSLPNLPANLTYLDCHWNELSSIPILPSNLTYLKISRNLITSIPNLPANLTYLNCYSNQLTNLPALSNSLNYLDCSGNLLSSIPNLPSALTDFGCSSNQLSNLPTLPNSLTSLNCSYNQIYCLPKLPQKLQSFTFDGKKINCLPNYPNPSVSIYTVDTLRYWSMADVCNPTNNQNNCLKSSVLVGAFVYTDFNNNNKLDAGEFGRRGVKLSSHPFNIFTNENGFTFLAADSLGSYTINAQAPNLYSISPASITHTFYKYDTIVYDTFALQPLVTKDSLNINITPINWAARPGFNYVYNISYDNAGTTTLNSNLSFTIDTSKLIFDSTNNAAASFSGNTLTYNFTNFMAGQNDNFYVYCRVKPTAQLGSSLQATASISGGSAVATDSVNAFIRGSFDPNDKQATPQLSVAQVNDNKHWIDYTIRFENTGNDTAFTVVVADTLLASKVQTNTVQLLGSSHHVTVTQNDHILYFEFRNINLPDSHINKIKCNGFVNFRVKPITTLTNGAIVPNKASIYFDYNSPVVTNTAQTLISNTLPLHLVAFTAIPKAEENKVLVYWNTANEINTSFFIIEQSTDGRTFKPAAEIAAKGSCNNSYYTSIAQNNLAFVRLKIVDKNGSYTYSNIVALSRNNNDKNLVIVSPTKTELKLNVVGGKLCNTQASIMNTQGKNIRAFMLKQGYQTINIATLANGLYYLQTIDGVRKFVKE